MESERAEAETLPSYFIWRRVQSLAGLGIVLFLMEHLLTNSQAALWLGEDGRGFIDGANWINSLPFIHVLEWLLVGIPIIVHAAWGIVYLFDANYNSFPTDGSKPSLPMYTRNQAYTWQRMTSYLLLVGIALHVYNMRVLHYPETAQIGDQKSYFVKLSNDPGLSTLAERLGFRVLSTQQVQSENSHIPQTVQTYNDPIQEQHIVQLKEWGKALNARPIKEGEVIAITKDFGTAELLVVRDNFKHWWIIILYTIFVLAAVFHAFNGLWTFMITWGIILTYTAQRIMLNITTALMVIFGLLGLSAIWLTYWVNLKH